MPTPAAPLTAQGAVSYRVPGPTSETSLRDRVTAALGAEGASVRSPIASAQSPSTHSGPRPPAAQREGKGDDDASADTPAAEHVFGPELIAGAIGVLALLPPPGDAAPLQGLSLRGLLPGALLAGAPDAQAAVQGTATPARLNPLPRLHSGPVAAASLAEPDVQSLQPFLVGAGNAVPDGNAAVGTAPQPAPVSLQRAHPAAAAAATTPPTAAAEATASVSGMPDGTPHDAREADRTALAHGGHVVGQRTASVPQRADERAAHGMSPSSAGGAALPQGRAPAAPGTRVTVPFASFGPGHQVTAQWGAGSPRLLLSSTSERSHQAISAALQAGGPPGMAALPVEASLGSGDEAPSRGRQYPSADEDAA